MPGAPDTLPEKPGWLKSDKGTSVSPLSVVPIPSKVIRPNFTRCENESMMPFASCVATTLKFSEEVVKL